jgi:hypothetical protein
LCRYYFFEMMKIRYFGIYDALDMAFALLIVKFEKVSRKTTHIISASTGRSLIEEHIFEKPDDVIIKEILERPEFADFKIIEIDDPKV